MKEPIKRKSEKIIAERVLFRIAPTVIGYVILTALAVAAFIICLKYEVESFVFTIIGLLELLFTVTFLIELISKKVNNSKRSVLITTDGEALIVYREDVRFIIGKDEIYDLSFKNEQSYIVTPYSVTTEVYNYGKVTIYVFDGQKKHKIRVKNVLNPERVVEKIVSFLKWDEYSSDEDWEAYE